MQHPTGLLCFAGWIDRPQIEKRQVHQMFDLTSSKLLILGIVALIVVGPKELPFLLRTLGKYIGMIKRQAAEFRSQFDDAMRESELDQIKKDVEGMGQEMQTTMREAEMSVEREVAQANADLDNSLAKPIPEADPLSAFEVPPPAQIEAVQIDAGHVEARHDQARYDQAGPVGPSHLPSAPSGDGPVKIDMPVKTGA